MIVEDLTAEHVVKMGTLAEIHTGFELTPELAVDLEQIGGRAVIDNGKVIAIGGILMMWPGVGMAWAWLTRDWRKHARRITAEVMAGLEASNFHRIEMGVKVGFLPGERWAKRLGFELETPRARKWGPDGGDYSIWVRVK